MTKENETPQTEKILAATYMRMSTDNQRYSIANQFDAIEEYAENNDMQIVATFTDKGKSGVSIRGREGLSTLLGLVNSGTAPFSAILVYDISRWGRFQDADESAYYEYQCKQKGIKVHYCAETFKNDGNPVSAILKSLKRAMAGEYSRELSVKVFKGQCRLVRMGYRQTGTPGYGLRRMLVDEEGKHLGILKTGQRKNIQNHRVILVKGPEHEIKNVHLIHRLYTKKRYSMRAIARHLNNKGLKTDRGLEWSEKSVSTVLTNEKYIGHNIYFKKTTKLGQKLTKNPPEKWIRKDNAFEAVVPLKMFNETQKAKQKRSYSITKELLTKELKAAYKKYGELSCKIIDVDKNLRHRTTYSKTFGSLKKAYESAGYFKRKMTKEDVIEELKKEYALHGRLSGTIIRKNKRLPHPDTIARWFNGLENAYDAVGYKRAKYTDAELIEMLKNALKQYGYLSCSIIDNSKELPDRNVFARHFGSIRNAYELAGYKKEYISDQEMIESLKRLHVEKGRLTIEIINTCPYTPKAHIYRERFGSVYDAYRMAGYETNHFNDKELLRRLRLVLKKHGKLTREIINQSDILPHNSTIGARFGSLRQAYKLVGFKK